MTQLRNFALVLFCALLGCLILSAPGARAQAVSPAGQAKPAKAAPELSSEEKRGKAFCLRGESSSGQEIMAVGQKEKQGIRRFRRLHRTKYSNYQTANSKQRKQQTAKSKQQSANSQKQTAATARWY